MTSVAPSGTISLIANTTAGIEPMFALAFTRAIVGRELLEVNPCFDRPARDRGFYSEHLIAEIAQRGGVRRIAGLPADVRAAFPVASEITPQWHLRMRAAVQRNVGAVVSKTVNLAAGATVADVCATYMAAWKAKSRASRCIATGADKVKCCLTPHQNPLWPRQALSSVAAAQAVRVNSDCR